MALSIDIHKIKEGDNQEFRIFFDYFYPKLMALACRYVPEFVAEDVVQGIFVRYWEQKHILELSSIKSFLFKCVQNSCLDYLKHRTVEENYSQEIFLAQERYNWLVSQTDKNEIWNELVLQDINSSLNKALNKLTPKCRQAFELSFYEELTYKEIGERMGISPRTVEEHVQKAIRVLRMELKDILIFWILIFKLIRF